MSVPAGRRERGRPALARARRSVRALSGPARRLPDFLIIGAQKAGTTSLYEYLVEHPRVAPATLKEIHYFDLNHRRGANWYRGHFCLRSREDVRCGEASPFYLFHPRAPARAAQLVPRAKLIVLFRHPVARAFSAHNHECALGNETLSFADAIAAEPGRLAGEGERLETDDDYTSYAWQHFAYLARGRYVTQVRRWLDCFPREQFLFLRAEDLFSDPAATYARVLDFLELPAFAELSFTARNVRTYDRMAPELWRDLSDGFAADNQALYDLVGEDYGWERMGPA